MPSNKNSLLIDRHGKITFASCFFCDLVDVEFRSAGGMSFFDFILSEDVEVVKAQLETSTQLPASQFVVKLKRSDGTPVWTEFQVAPIKTPSGEAYALNASVTLASGPTVQASSKCTEAERGPRAAERSGEHPTALNPSS